MHEAKPYGHLLVNGKRVTDVQLANLTGIPQDQLTELFGELDNAGVLSRNSEGTIYSRRMTRDAQRAADGERYGKRGGNPALTHNPTLNPHPNPTPAPRGQRLEPDIPKKDFLEKIGQGPFSSRTEKPWTPEQKKAAWQSGICNEAQRTLPAEQYVQFLEAWAENDPKAVKLAEQIDKRLKAESRRKIA